MKTLVLNAFVMFALFLSCARSTVAQPAPKGAPVVVQNTTTNPVPVTGGVTVTNTPTVQIDPNANVVKLDPSATPGVQVVSSQSSPVYIVPIAPLPIKRDTGTEGRHFVGAAQDWSTSTADLHAYSDDGQPYASKVWACVSNKAPQPVEVSVYTLIGWGSTLDDEYFSLDHFQLPANNDSCKVYDVPGFYIEVIVQAIANTTGRAVIGISQR